MQWKRYGIAGLTLGWLALGAPAGAADLKLGVTGEVEYDTNVFRTEEEMEDDIIFRVSPRVKLYEEEGNYEWLIDYVLPYEYGLDSHSQIDELNHHGHANARVRLGANTEAYFDDRIRYSTEYSTTNSFDDSNDLTLNEGREPVILNRAELGLVHSFSPRLTGDTQFGHEYFDSDIGDRSNYQTFTSISRLLYQLNAHHRVGGGVMGAYQDFDESNDGERPASRSIFGTVFGAWTWFIDERTTFEVVAGPTIVDTEQDEPEDMADSLMKLYPHTGDGSPFVYVFDIDSCEEVRPGVRILDCEAGAAISSILNPADVTAILDAGNATAIRPGFTGYEDSAGVFTALDTITGDYGSVHSTDLTVFGEVSLTRRWTPNWKTTLSYTRRQTGASGISNSSAIMDGLGLRSEWKINERWHLSTWVDGSLREELAEGQRVYPVVSAPGVAYGGLGCPADPACLPSGLNDVAYLTGELTSVEENQFLETFRLDAGNQIRYLVNKNLSLFARHRFALQNSKSDSVGDPSDFDTHLFTIGFDYDFDRIHLW